MTSKHEILFICTGNSGRSILAESIVNNEYSEKLVGFSAGTLPRDEVNPEILKYLNETGHDTSRLNPKSWEVYGSSKAHKFDIIVTVCDQAANEACPVWPGNPTSCHWGVPDPTKIEDTNLKTISYIKNKYKCLVGFSDHTSDTICANAAIANGANIIEKHYKLTKKDKGLDAQFSLDPKTMKKLIDETHKTWMSIGELKSDTLKNEIIYKKYRRSIYICKDVKKNQLINLSNVKVIRPGKGIEPKYLPKISIFFLSNTSSYI